MPRTDDYDCECGTRFEHMRMTTDEVVACPSCRGTAVNAMPGGRPLATIVPMHRGSLKHKAGFVHSHGDRPAEKGSVAVPANKGSF